MAETAIVQVDLSKELSTESNTTYCSIQGGDRKTLARVYNAANNPEHKVGDYINKVINVKDVLVEIIDIENEDGTVEQAPRVVLIDEKGEAPTWDDPLPMLIKQVSVKNGSMLTVEIKL